MLVNNQVEFFCELRLGVAGRKETFHNDKLRDFIFCHNPQTFLVFDTCSARI